MLRQAWGCLRGICFNDAPSDTPPKEAVHIGVNAARHDYRASVRNAVNKVENVPPA
jgi:hypothetical protein